MYYCYDTAPSSNGQILIRADVRVELQYVPLVDRRAAVDRKGNKDKARRRAAGWYVHVDEFTFMAANATDTQQNPQKNRSERGEGVVKCVSVMCLHGNLVDTVG